MSETRNADSLVKTYIKIRDAKQAKERALKDEIKELDVQLSTIEQELLEICKDTGQDGGKTSSGTFTRSVKRRYWTNDWDSMYKFINEHSMPELLEKRLHQQNFVQFITENPDVMPEGVNVESKYSVTVYRPR
jgi:hypothetical protein